MQKAVINLIMASVIIFSAFAIGNEVKKAVKSDVKTSALLACRLLYAGGLVIGLQALTVLIK